MQIELLIEDKMIPVRFISSDQKAIPQLLQALTGSAKPASETMKPELGSIEHIELIGNHAVLHCANDRKPVHLPLY